MYKIKLLLIAGMFYRGLAWCDIHRIVWQVNYPGEMKLAEVAALAFFSLTKDSSLFDKSPAKVYSVEFMVAC
jgi:hypothetical protein